MVITGLIGNYLAGGKLIRTSMLRMCNASCSVYKP